MRNRPLSLVLSAASICVALCTANARAQNNPELGDVRHNPPPPAPEPVAPAASPHRAATNPFDRDVATTGTDHAAVIGHLGVGWYGVYSLPYGATTLSMDGTTANAPSVDAPSIGARYWLNETLAIEGALGLGIISGTVKNKTGTTSIETNEPSLFGLALHAALPIALATSQHFTFEVIPELNFGFTSGGRERRRSLWHLARGRRARRRRDPLRLHGHSAAGAARHRGPTHELRRTQPEHRRRGKLVSPLPLRHDGRRHALGYLQDEHRRDLLLLK
jgi:hypothetical protein